MITRLSSTISKSADRTGASWLGNSILPGGALLHFTGANNSTTFTDSVFGINATVAGSASIITSDYVFSPSCGKFTAAGSYIQLPSNSAYAIGTQDFTIECWVKKDSQANQYGGIFNIGTFSSGLMVRWQTTGNDNVWINNTSYTFPTSSNIPAGGGWYHVALTRQSGTCRAFIGGALITTFTNSSSIPQGAITIGTAADSTSLTFNGWIDEFRLAIGKAFYTAAFTPPSAPLTPFP